MANEYNAYLDAYAQINPQPCIFEKAILIHCCNCNLAEKRLLAERETVNCYDYQAWQLCIELYDSLCNCSLFNFKLIKLDSPLPHGKAIKIQCGGLQGLQQLLNGTTKITNINQLINDLLINYGDLTALPYSDLIRRINNFKIRQ